MNKNIAGLVSQTITNELFRYTVLRNGSEINVTNGEESKSIMFARYLCSSPCHVRINFEILLTVTPATSGGTVEIKATYKADGAEISDRHPIETWHAGKHILTLQYDLEHDDAVSHSFDLWLECTGGNVYIAENDGYEVISSTGLASDKNWEGTFRGEDGNLYIVIDGQTHKIPDSIKVGRYPNKSVYEYDEPLDYTGVIILAVFGDGNTVDITQSCIFSPSEGTPYDSEQDTYIEVNYTTWTVEYATGFDLSYNYLVELTITPPTKTDYKYGQHIDYSGLVVYATYRDGTQINVTNNCEITPANGTFFEYYKLT